MEKSKTVAEIFKNSSQLSLGEIICKIEAAIDKAKSTEYPDPQVYFDFEYIFPTKLMSWRGVYSELSLGFSIGGTAPKASKLLTELKSAIGKTFTGYKGGDFVMGRSTPVWVANHGNCGNTAIYDIAYDGYKITIVTGYCES